METLLTFTAVVITVALLFIGYLEWQKATRERKADILSRLIKAAEMAVASGAGSEKKAWVLDRLQIYFPHATREELDETIEAGVFELKHIIGIRPRKTAQEFDDQGGMFWMQGRHN